MYKVTVTISTKGKKMPEIRNFELDEMGTGDYHEQMNDISDFLYDLDIDFDVDQDGDMLIDDILMSISEEEPFETIIREEKQLYVIKGERA